MQDHSTDQWKGKYFQQVVCVCTQEKASMWAISLVPSSLYAKCEKGSGQMCIGPVSLVSL